MLKVYGCYKSRATRILWLTEELELAFDHVPVIQAARLEDPLAKDAPINTRTPEFVAIAPYGAIPAIEDDGMVLFESLAITLYLAKQYSQGNLGPANLEEDAQMMQWALFAATAIESEAVKINMLAATGKLDTDAGKAEADAAARLLQRPFKVLEKHFNQQAFMVADRFTVADINMAEIVRYAQPRPDILNQFPALNAWLLRCQDRPAFKVMWEKRAAE